MTSPPSPQPKQWNVPWVGRTLNDGVFSSWNGHRPLTAPPPTRRNATYSPITSSIWLRSRTRAMSLSRIRPATSQSLGRTHTMNLVTVSMDALADEFATHRSHLLGVAYRLTSTLADAEDAVQEAWLRLSTVESTGIRDLRGWLTTVVGRICLDRLRSAAVRREHYTGSWLPEPVV